jgi:hypothetical protein
VVIELWAVEVFCLTPVIAYLIFLRSEEQVHFTTPYDLYHASGRAKPRRSGHSPGLGRVGFVVNEVALEQVSLPVLFAPTAQTIIYYPGLVLKAKWWPT